MGGEDGGGEGGGGGGGGDVFWIYWRTPEEWASVVEAWVDDTAQKNTVLTLYELSQGEETVGAGTFRLFSLFFLFEEAPPPPPPFQLLFRSFSSLSILFFSYRSPEVMPPYKNSQVGGRKGIISKYPLMKRKTLARFVEFHGLDPELLQKALQVLVKRNKAQIFGQEDQLGVKFF